MSRKHAGALTLLLALPSTYYFAAAAVIAAAFIAFGGQPTHKVSGPNEFIGLFLGAFMIIGAAAMGSFIALVTAGVLLLRNRGQRFAGVVLGLAAAGAGVVFANSILRGAPVASLSFVGPAVVTACDATTMLFILGPRGGQPADYGVGPTPTR